MGDAKTVKPGEEVTYHNEPKHPQRGVLGKYRDDPASIAKAVEKGGHITLETLKELLDLLEEKTEYGYHIAVEIDTGPMLKVLDNERDAKETIRRLKAKP